MTDSTLDVLAQRLERLERESRRWKAAAASLASRPPSCSSTKAARSSGRRRRTPPRGGIQQASQFEAVINLKTAKALGVTIPTSMLERADHVIR